MMPATNFSSSEGESAIAITVRWNSPDTLNVTTPQSEDTQSRVARYTKAEKWEIDGRDTKVAEAS